MYTFVKPLKNVKVTQPFGVDWIGDGFYRKLGMKGHNGQDYSCITGTELFAVMDGECYVDDEKVMGKGYGNVIRQRNRILGLEVVYGHLHDFEVKDGHVAKAGELIAHTGNTGLSTGPHLHIGVRKMRYTNGAGPFYDEYDNGYFGYIDPAPFFDPQLFQLPVEYRYGMKESERGYSDIQWYGVAAWFWRTFKRLPTTIEKNALVWGRWDVRTVMDPVMFQVWTQYSKPAAKAKGFVK